MYLGVVEVRDPAGQPLDHLVMMRRLPANRRLAAVLAGAGEEESDHVVREVARSVAAFHEAQAPVPDGERVASGEAVMRLWEDGFPVTRSVGAPDLDPAVGAEIEELARTYVGGRTALFEARVAAGMVRDGHGDLQADDIFVMPDGPRILDCLDFDDRLRAGDILSDAAFLAMDLERLGHPAAAARFLRYHGEFTTEHHPASLAHFYIAYRAHVRAKVACIRIAQGQPAAAAEARALQDLCLAHLRAATTRLVLVGGAPGTGKSTLARGLADTAGLAVLSSDAVRRDMWGDDPGPTAYTPEARGRVYRQLLERAWQLLSMGVSVVADATWADEGWRDGAMSVALHSGSALSQVRCVAPAELAAARSERRQAAGTDLSDAGATESQAISATFAPWPSAIQVDTSGNAEDALAAVLERLGTLAVERTRVGALA